MSNQKLTSFNPPQRLLMGPGPSDIHPRVLAAMARPTVGHLDPAFQTMMEEIKAGLRYAFQTENALTFPVSAPGSAGMECCFVNLVEPGDTVIVIQHGAFGGRMKENVERAGGHAVLVAFEWGQPIELESVRAALETHASAKILAFVHAETSTGVSAPAKELCDLAQAHDCLTIVDCVTSLGGSELKVDEWGIDAAYSGTQKCLSCPPGISPVTFSERAADKIKQRQSSVQSWFLDLSLVMAYWDNSGGGARTYHHTAPVNAMYALHEGLVMLQEEGLEEAQMRHHAMHQKLKAGLESLGLGLIVDESHRLSQLNTVSIPDGIDEAAVRQYVLQKYDLEIGAGLGALAGKVWRIGLMGSSATERHVMTCLTALEDALKAQQYSVQDGAGTAAAMAVED
ncbi:alanine--glyoxylate aminotransferase family protein [Temperatibacter marinus]|uniref:Alanine--glyoxylate aminotransferase family protein n=1 Tax=Temperatibacter marinus TaxID=1456591 RepID=A0AA52EAT4_9PROT|nr:alanine--glyoxylate aminotransferase family protein [Temperatibacter marinus]WND01426.1 alanine--glyoxylate aminotransferase family protein [Temperatibacter marinus]